MGFFVIVLVLSPRYEKFLQSCELCCLGIYINTEPSRRFAPASWAWPIITGGPVFSNANTGSAVFFLPRRGARKIDEKKCAWA